MLNIKLKGRISRCIVFYISVVLIISIMGSLFFPWNTCTYAEDYYANYADALQKAVYFFDTQKCGPENNGIEWRGACHTGDASISLKDTNLSKEFIAQYKDMIDPDYDGKLDLSGGFHDSGDGMKFGLPQCYTASTLEWAMYEYGSALKKSRTGSTFAVHIKVFY